MKALIVGIIALNLKTKQKIPKTNKKPPITKNQKTPNKQYAWNKYKYLFGVFAVVGNNVASW